MQKARAVTKFLRVVPRKARFAADLIRGLPVDEANSQLEYSTLKGSRLMKKTLKSAIANAEMQSNLRRENMYVLDVRVDEGSRHKRAKSKCRGGRSPVLKRTSHFTVVVGEK